MSPAWELEHHIGSAVDFHGRDIPEHPRRALWWFEVVRPAIVLGSAQRGEVLDRASAEAAGIEIVRRRSGGGAVWLDPHTVTWVDLILPADDPAWERDVTASTDWLGTVWVEVLRELGLTDTVVHRGAMRRSVDSDLICFAGRAAGEVFLDDRKVVGISQRRSRRAARFQCSVLHEWEPERLVEHLLLSPAERVRLLDRLAEVATGIGPIASRDVVEALVRQLSRI